MTTKTVTLRELKEGHFIVIDGEPCKIVSISTSKTGKHGAAKARVEGIGILDGQKRSLVAPVDSKVEVPVILKKPAQVIAIMGDTVQLMDLETYETYELPKPSKEELEGKELAEGMEVEVLETMGRRKITRIRSG